jgi:uncharacterized protein (TIGR02996 family)
MASNPEEGFLQAIADAPEDNTSRLVYSDWLEEQGNTDRAEYIRLEIEKANLGSARSEEHKPRLQAIEKRLKKLLRGRRWVGPDLPTFGPDVAIQLQFERGFPAAISFTQPATQCADLRALVEAESILTRMPLPVYWYFSETPHPQEARRLLEILQDAGLTQLIRHLGLPGENSPDLFALVPEFPELRGLYIGWGELWGDTQMELLPRLPHLRKVVLSNCRQLTDAGLRPLGAVKGLRILSLAWMEKLTGEGFASLADNKQMEVVELVIPDRFQSAAFRHFAGWTKLRVLHFSSNSEFDDSALPHLRNLTALESLSFSGSKVIGTGFRDFPPLKRLTYLDLGQSPVNDDGLRSLPAMPMLEYLGVCHAPFLKTLRLHHLPHLHQLDCWGTPVEALDFVELPALEEFNVYSQNLTDAGLAGIVGAANLRKLGLWECCKLTDAAFAGLTALSKLQTLTVSDCLEVTGSGLVHLAGLPELHALTLLNLSGLTSLSGVRNLVLPHLTDLVLEDLTSLTDEGLARLIGSPNLRRLSLKGCVGLTDAAIPHLAKLTDLKSLKLARCRNISHTAKAEIRRLLPGCKVAGK